MTKLSIFSSLSNVQMILHTALKGKKVGTDQLGNVYYTGKPKTKGGRERRWVMYAAVTDSSQVPPEWHGWLHHQTDILPNGTSKFRQPWQKPHQPNLSGTDQAYFPPGASGKELRDGTTGDYVAWQPPKN